MRTATNSANSMQRVNTQAAGHRSTSASAASRTQDSERTLRMGTDEAAVLNIDLAGLPLPKVGGLNVDGFKPTLFQRLFGKR